MARKLNGGFVQPVPSSSPAVVFLGCQDKTIGSGKELENWNSVMVYETFVDFLSGGIPIAKKQNYIEKKKRDVQLSVCLITFVGLF